MAIKYKQETGAVCDVESAISELQELGNECREVFDAASEALQQTARNQTMQETAEALENLELSAGIPDIVSELPFTYPCELPRDKRSGLSRRARRDNAVAILTSAKEALEEWVSENGESTDEVLKDEVATLIQELDEHISAAEGCEFPGMFG